ncbi:DoxX family membrane protein [Saccharothrix violaceirubra]|uniref:Putative membrane protein YphA (DoxX/SURF4 family) n=1 Tax=Saccharothrix violaceirubra TaxID=413306 RepID=A0A7W7T6M5_9PSEU|nr:DoxX family membrane protein [Saccharothrix violaceirubra]MBB4967002.1 putative membrane protein YphA (DoxX/SURF4 family) [Saccharothrix violaceirubra]
MREEVRLADRVAMPALRVSLGLVFVWFGLLKVVGETPIAALLEASVPWVDPDLLVPGLGWFEVVLGVALVVGRYLRAVLAAMGAHLLGTFIVFVQAPGMAFAGGNPLLLTVNGEFVLKNLVLLCAVLVLFAEHERR